MRVLQAQKSAVSLLKCAYYTHETVKSHSNCTVLFSAFRCPCTVLSTFSGVLINMTTELKCADTQTIFERYENTFLDDNSQYRTQNHFVTTQSCRAPSEVYLNLLPRSLSDSFSCTSPKRRVKISQNLFLLVISKSRRPFAKSVHHLSKCRSTRVLSNLPVSLDFMSLVEINFHLVFSQDWKLSQYPT